MIIEFEAKTYRLEGHIEGVDDDERLLKLLDFLGFYNFEHKKIGNHYGIRGYLDTNISRDKMATLLTFLGFRTFTFEEVSR